MDFELKFKELQDKVNTYLERIIPKNHEYINTILNSMRYSMFAGGKRMRPVLMLGTGEIFDCCEDDIMPYAAGMEMIHTYSLIHDDLPAMDNDDYRRGLLTNHKVYGEAMAILAGDGLLNLAFEQMLEYAARKNESRFIDAARIIANSSGMYGMIGGQVVDLENTGKIIDKNVMDFMHNCKTGALIRASVKAGAVISKAGNEDLVRLEGYARDLGLAFQIIDDILDVTGDEKKLGKRIGSDSYNNKATYVSMFGLDKSREIARQLSQSALEKIKYYKDRAEFLNQLTLFLLEREY